MRVISTKRLPATNTKPTRIVADDGAGHRVVISWDGLYSWEENHIRVVRALCSEERWKGKLVGSDVCRNYQTVGMCWVWVDHLASTQFSVEFFTK